MNKVRTQSMRELSIETYWHYNGPDSELSLGDVACNYRLRWTPDQERVEYRDLLAS